MLVERGRLSICPTLGAATGGYDEGRDERKRFESFGLSAAVAAVLGAACARAEEWQERERFHRLAELVQGSGGA